MATTFDQWLTAKLTAPDRESAMGYHYVQTFMQDPYSWYLKYVRGLKPIHTKPALIKGGIIHSAIEAAYLYDADSAHKTLATLFDHRRPEYENPEQHATDWRDSEAMLCAWLTTWLTHDKDTYHLMHIEDPFELPLPNGFLISVRFDALLQSKTDGELRVLDHKTTGYSPMAAHKSLDDSDQSTCYQWAASKLYPNNRIIGVESDVIFKRSNMRAAKCQRVGIVQRTPWYIDQWQIAMIAWLSDIARRVHMLNEGYPPAFAFPRGESYWGPNDWPGIYRAPLPDDPTEPPHGYTIDAWQQDRAQAILTLKEATQ